MAQAAKLAAHGDLIGRTLVSRITGFSGLSFAALGFLLAFASPSVLADKIILKHGIASKRKEFSYIPFALYTEELDFGVGIGFCQSGLQQGQAGIYGAGLYTSNHSYTVFLRGSKFRVMERLFFDATYIDGRYKTHRIYARSNPDFPGDRGGTNESLEENFIVAPGRDYFFELDSYYVLPFGDGQKNIIKEYVLVDGVLSSSPSGGESWNPVTSGRSYVHFVPFYRSQDFDFDLGQSVFNTNGVKLEFEYDNRDFPENPPVGSYQEFRVLRDFGLGDSSDSWSVIDLKASKYFSLGESALTRQRVIALNFWTADTPTWEQREEGSAITDKHRPPPYMGATLGGVNRLRAYPSERFNDKAAIYYSAEYRFMPRTNPLGKISLLRRFDIDWWQFVGFIEMGRVAPDWNIKTLHSNVQGDIGIGLRAMALRSIVRLDAAFSDETWQVYAMVGHPF